MNALDYNLKYAVSMANYIHNKIKYEEKLIPINLEDILKYRTDIAVIKQDLLGLDGFSIYDSRINKYIIAVDNVNFDLTRQRFTLAHELGHIFLQHHTKYRYLNGYIKEKSANAFAGELLMPKDMMYKTAKYPTNYILSIYGVSFSAYEKRKEFLNEMYNFESQIDNDDFIAFEDLIQYTKHSLYLNDQHFVNI